MATTRLSASCHFPASRRFNCESYVGLKARTVRIRFGSVQIIAALHPHKVRSLVVNAVSAPREMPKKSYPGEPKGFVDEMKLVVMKLHPRDQVKEVNMESKSVQDGHVSTWKFTVEGYLKFLVDSKLVFHTLERIIHESTLPIYAGLKNTGLERAEKLSMDLEWFKEQGYEIPEPMAPGKLFSQHLKDIAEKDPQAFICHFYNINFAHSAGGRMIGTKVSKRILDNKELQFYKWDGQLSELLKNVSDELNKIAELWTREEKNHCLEETEISFKLYWEIFGYLMSKFVNK